MNANEASIVAKYTTMLQPVRKNRNENDIKKNIKI